MIVQHKSFTPARNVNFESTINPIPKIQIFLYTPALHARLIMKL
jgi:hypothetical protein